jgi:hypothetical protein
MTGNTVLLGLAVFQDHGDVLPLVISLGFYALGAAGAKALVLLSFSARLKSCPDTKHFSKLARNRLIRALVLQSSIKPSMAASFTARLNRFRKNSVLYQGTTLVGP